MKIEVLQLNYEIGNFEANSVRILSAYFSAIKKGAELVICSELSLSGYPPRDLLLRDEFFSQQDEVINKLCNAVGEIGLIVGVALRDSGKIYNSAILIHNHSYKVVSKKTLLPNYDVFEERRFFTSNDDVPIFFSYGKEELRFCVLICEDIWLASFIKNQNYQGYDNQKDPVEKIIGKVDCLVVLNASPFEVGKQEVRFKIVAEVAKRIRAGVVYVNQIGGNDELIFDGTSVYVNQHSKIIKVLKSFCEDCQTIDLMAVKISITPPIDLIGSIYEALVLGIRDYISKTKGPKSVLVGLSGGIDSAVVAALATAALGKQFVEAIFLPSMFSSIDSANDAKEIASLLKIKYSEIPIESIYSSFAATLKSRIGWKTPGEDKSDVTEENVQARIRGVILMAIANRKRLMVLNTSNKSEISVGYGTLYGDMIGGLAVIADIYKWQVYDLARYINNIEQVIPSRVISKQPSAELYPGQKDSDSLLPYKTLDEIIQLYVEGGAGIEEISTRIKISKEIISDTIKKINGSEFKRRQFPLALRVSKKAFGIGRHFPIAARFLV